MEIYVVQQGDDIFAIANKFSVSVDRLIQENGLIYPYKLIIGQALVITYPKQSHTVQQGDTLQSIADLYNITLLQIFRNNQSLSNRKYVYTGETLVISYNTKGNITTNGFAYPFIQKETLYKTLPNLTYLSIFNYSVVEKGEILAYYEDDSALIKSAKDYGVIPLMMITTLNQQGEPNVENAYRILLNDEYQERNIHNFIDIMKRKSYQGINIVFNSINKDNQLLYENFVKKIAAQLQVEGFLIFVTINYQSQVSDGKIILEEIDYAELSPYVNGLIFLRLEWGTRYGPPVPVIDINNAKALFDYVAPVVTSDKMVFSIPMLGYDWSLPYIPNKSSANSLSINAVLDIAYNSDTKIEFDENSQTPFFYYTPFNVGINSKHIIWFVDARTMKAFVELISEKGLNGCGIWNVMIYNSQLWTIINSLFDIVKL